MNIIQPSFKVHRWYGCHFYKGDIFRSVFVALKGDSLISSLPRLQRIKCRQELGLGAVFMNLLGYPYFLFWGSHWFMLLVP